MERPRLIESGRGGPELRGPPGRSGGGIGRHPALRVVEGARGARGGEARGRPLARRGLGPEDGLKSEEENRWQRGTAVGEQAKLGKKIKNGKKALQKGSGRTPKTEIKRVKKINVETETAQPRENGGPRGLDPLGAITGAAEEGAQWMGRGGGLLRHCADGPILTPVWGPRSSPRLLRHETVRRSEPE
ncbi:hypothetical protein NDU88_001019 [Pleurodeles waltl]|uniref:Uncharacterized protein n=1 Tax=Pleurodeles waltl TaxID=8319 RepID=A0AAV7Q7D1_PLEWA|nr:hypothetical protein NDU88_001019 [Pleurodeles waltl]